MGESGSRRPQRLREKKKSIGGRTGSAPGGAPAARLELGARGLCVLFAAVGVEAKKGSRPTTREQGGLVDGPKGEMRPGRLGSQTENLWAGVYPVCFVCTVAMLHDYYFFYCALSES